MLSRLTKQSVDAMRKRRLARLGGAKWTPHPSAPVDWLVLEKALGRELTETQREEISKLVAVYLMFEGMERAAPFVRDEQNWLHDLRACASELRRMLVTRRTQNAAAREGLAEVEVEFAKIARTVFGSSPISLGDVASILEPVIDAVISRERPPGIIEGERWCQLVAGLAMKFKQWGLPTGIRKDSDKRALGDLPFVTFFKELQATFPEESRRSHQSSVALAQAMSAALRENKSPPSDG